jgi:hypothetical protein
MPTLKRVIPLLAYQDIAAAHDFLVRAFGLASGGVHRTPEGVAVHGEVRAGDAAIWLHRVAAESQLDSPRALMWPIPAWSSTSTMSTHITSSPGPRVHASTASPSISRTANVNMARVISKATVGTSQRR